MLSVSGPTKSGKTVLLKRFFEDALWVSGGAIETADELWAEIVDELEVFTDIGLAADAETQHGGVLGVDAGLTATGSVSETTRRGTTRGRTRSAKNAARDVLRARKPTLIIDDFHYIPAAEQLRIVRTLKDLVFEGLPVIVAAVPHRAYDAVRVEKEMTGRVDALPVGLWSDSDLAQIAEKGFEILGVSDAQGALAAKLAEESFGSPHLMQTHCLYLCQEPSNGDAVLSREGTDLGAPDWEIFFSRRASATSKTAFDLLKQGPRQRQDRMVRKLKSGTETDIYGAVLAAIESTGPKTALTYEEVRAALRQTLASDIPQRHEVTNVLEQMTSIAREKIAGEPVLEYDPEYSTLDLADPFFAYYLRWAPEEMKDLAVS
jgi:hypothetical protein